MSRGIRLSFGLLLVSFCFACTTPQTNNIEQRPTAAASSETININSASIEELRRIPSFGEKIATAIVDHRERHGKFRRIEELLLLDGVSDRRFREIRHLIRVD